MILMLIHFNILEVTDHQLDEFMARETILERQLTIAKRKAGYFVWYGKIPFPSLNFAYLNPPLSCLLTGVLLLL